MGEEVEEAEEDGGGLLHAEEAVEGPFAVVLHNRVQEGRVAGEALGGGDVLAGVVAFGGAVPEEEAVLEGWKRALGDCSVEVVLAGTYVCASHGDRN